MFQVVMHKRQLFLTECHVPVSMFMRKLIFLSVKSFRSIPWVNAGLFAISQLPVFTPGVFLLEENENGYQMLG